MASISLGRSFSEGDIVRHFKRELATPDELASEPKLHMYKIIAFAKHTETSELLVIYRALYGQCETFARPANMFMSEVDRTMYPEVKQQYRLEKVEEEAV